MCLKKVKLAAGERPEEAFFRWGDVMRLQMVGRSRATSSLTHLHFKSMETLHAEAWPDQGTLRNMNLNAMV